MRCSNLIVASAVALCGCGGADLAAGGSTGSAEASNVEEPGESEASLEDSQGSGDGSRDVDAERAAENADEDLAELLANGGVGPSMPEPLLPHVAREDLVSDLSSLDFDSLCAPYLDNAVSAANNAVGLCAMRGLAAAEATFGASLDEYQDACRVARTECEDEAAQRNLEAGAVRCRQAASCDATVGDVDRCNASLSLLDVAILMPANTWPIPACAELTPEVGAQIDAEVRGVILQTYRELSLGSVADDCAVVHDRCTDLAVPLPVRGD